MSLSCHFSAYFVPLSFLFISGFQRRNEFPVRTYFPFILFDARHKIRDSFAILTDCSSRNDKRKWSLEIAASIVNHSKSDEQWIVYAHRHEAREKASMKLECSRALTYDRQCSVVNLNCKIQMRSTLNSWHRLFHAIAHFFTLHSSLVSLSFTLHSVRNKFSACGRFHVDCIMWCQILVTIKVPIFQRAQTVTISDTEDWFLRPRKRSSETKFDWIDGVVHDSFSSALICVQRRRTPTVLTFRLIAHSDACRVPRVYTSSYYTCTMYMKIHIEKKTICDAHTKNVHAILDHKRINSFTRFKFACVRLAHITRCVSFPWLVFLYYRHWIRLIVCHSVAETTRRKRTTNTIFIFVCCETNSLLSICVSATLCMTETSKKVPCRQANSLTLPKCSKRNKKSEISDEKQKIRWVFALALNSFQFHFLHERSSRTYKTTNFFFLIFNVFLALRPFLFFYFPIRSSGSRNIFIFHFFSSVYSPCIASGLKLDCISYCFVLFAFQISVTRTGRISRSLSIVDDSMNALSWKPNERKMAFIWHFCVIISTWENRNIKIDWRTRERKPNKWRQMFWSIHTHAHTSSVTNAVTMN